jgi:hypothetical protein
MPRYIDMSSEYAEVVELPQLLVYKDLHYFGWVQSLGNTFIKVVKRNDYKNYGTYIEGLTVLQELNKDYCKIMSKYSNCYTFKVYKQKNGKYTRKCILDTTKIPVYFHRIN